MSEILYACPFCKREGFTHRGLSAHWCDQAPRDKTSILYGLPRRRLTTKEITKAVVSTPVPPQP